MRRARCPSIKPPANTAVPMHLPVGLRERVSRGQCGWVLRRKGRLHHPLPLAAECLAQVREGAGMPYYSLFPTIYRNIYAR